jgi:hypothetical protein
LKYGFYIKLIFFSKEIGESFMKITPKQNYSADLAEKCRKALEVSFGNIPMPREQIKRKVVSKRRLLAKEGC